MVTSTDVSMRDLRNHTKTVIEQIEDGATMYLTKNGERIATITPLRPKTWADHVDDVLGGGAVDGADVGGSEGDSGMSELLAAADAESAVFDDDHLDRDHLDRDHVGIDRVGIEP